MKTILFKAILLFTLMPAFVFAVNDGNDTLGTAPNTGQDLNAAIINSQANNDNYYQGAVNNSSQGTQPQTNGGSAMVATPNGILGGNSLNLTDEERRLSEEYVNDGANLRLQKKLCDELDDPNACLGSEPKSKFMGMSSTTVKALSSAYALVAGKMDTTIDMKPDGSSPGPDSDATGTSSTQETDKGKSKKDNCKYIAVGVEAVALFQTQLAGENAKLSTGAETDQKEVLYKAARSHEDRAKSHKLQYVGWGATTACYVYMLSTGASLSTSNLLKLGAAGMLTFFFKDQMDVNQDYADSIKGIADKLSGKGVCNPITERDCYCMQKENVNDPTYCVPQLGNQKVSLGNYRVACIDVNAKVDPKCTCIDADACLNKRFKNKINPLGFGTAFNSAALRPINNISRGQLTAADISSTYNGALAAYNRNGLNKFGAKSPSAGQLSLAQQKAVKDLKELGIHPKLGALLAKQKVSAQGRTGLNRFKRGFLGRSKRSFRSSRKRRSNVLNFSGGGGANRKKSKKRKGAYSNFMNKFKKKGRAAKKGKILDYGGYGTKALQSAQISKDKDRPIFDIISRRYQVSGFKRLNIDRK